MARTSFLRVETHDSLWNVGTRGNGVRNVMSKELKINTHTHKHTHSIILTVHRADQSAQLHVHPPRRPGDKMVWSRRVVDDPTKRTMISCRWPFPWTDQGVGCCRAVALGGGGSLHQNLEEENLCVKDGNNM